MTRLWAASESTASCRQKHVFVFEVGADLDSYCDENPLEHDPGTSFLVEL